MRESWKLQERRAYTPNPLMNTDGTWLCQVQLQGKDEPISERDGKQLVVTSDVRDVDLRCPSCGEFEGRQGSF